MREVIAPATKTPMSAVPDSVVCLVVSRSVTVCARPVCDFVGKWLRSHVHTRLRSLRKRGYEHSKEF